MASGQRRRALAVGYFCFLGIIILSDLVTSRVRQVLDRLLDGLPTPVIVLIVLFVMAVPLFWVFKVGMNNAHRIFGSTARMNTTDRIGARRFLIMGYSPMKPELVGRALECAHSVPVERLAAPSAEYDDFVHDKCLGIEVNLWQQNLRSAYAHRDKLEQILVLNPDIDQFESFRSFLKTCFAELLPDLKIRLIGERHDSSRPFGVYDGYGILKPRSYEDYEYVYEGMSRGLEMVQAECGGDDADQEICIDATPGYKPFSIAAAVLTLNRNLIFSYVTSGMGTSGGHVRFYDAKLDIR